MENAVTKIVHRVTHFLLHHFYFESNNNIIIDRKCLNDRWNYTKQYNNTLYFISKSGAHKEQWEFYIKEEKNMIDIHIIFIVQHKYHNVILASNT